MALCRVFLEQSETNKYEQKKKHPVTNTPIRPHTRTPARIPTRTPGIVCSYQLETEIEKNQLRFEKKQTNRQIKCYTSDKELQILIRGTLADTRRHQRVASGASGPLLHLATKQNKTFVRNFWTGCFT